MEVTTGKQFLEQLKQGFGHPGPVLDRLRLPLTTTLVIIAVIQAVVFLALTLWGTIVRYSPVPYWDEWDGYLGFYLRAMSGDVDAGWRPHTAHRIFMSRVFFWMDLHWFNGELWFLLIVNMIFAFIICLVFWLLARRLLNESNDTSVRLAFCATVVALVFSWIQHDNFVWAFQHSVWAAQLFAVSAFYFLARSAPKGNLRYISLSFCCGAAAAVTQGNGIFVLPLVLLAAMALRLPARALLILAAGCVLVLTMYLSGMRVGGKMLATLAASPIDSGIFALASIGAIAKFAGAQGMAIPAALGFCLLCVLSYAAWRAVSRRAPYEVALVCVASFSVASSALIALNRLEWGMEAAFTSRYMTNTVIGWVAVSLLLANMLSRAGRRFGVVALIGLPALPALLLPYQLAVAAPLIDETYERRLLAALALELAVPDRVELDRITDPGTAHRLWNLPSLDFIEVARTRNLSVFGRPEIRDARELMKSKWQVEGARCSGDLISIGRGEPMNGYVPVGGWLVDRYRAVYPRAVVLLNAERNVVGWAVSGFRAPVSDTLGNEVFARSRFRGYLLREFADADLILVGRDVNCERKTDKFSTDFLVASPMSNVNWDRGLSRGWGPAIAVTDFP
ncbi:MAG: hypothetical protein ACK50G_01830, partial [bacterium]